MKIVVFDLWGDYAHFRVPYTTSSPLTFPIPTKTACYGILGAILGYSKIDNVYLKNFQNKKWKIAIKLNKPIAKTHIPENFIDTKKVKMFARMPQDKACRTQVNIEFLKAPSYRIYVYSEGDDFLNLERFLKEHKSTYTVSLGLSECLADFKYIGTFNGECVENNKTTVDISSILPINTIDIASDIDFVREGKAYMKIHMPTEMNINREIIETMDFLLESSGYAINAKVDKYIKVKELSQNIILF